MQHTRMVPMEGRTLSHYRIVEKLGGGGMGIVYKAEDLRLKRMVALKFLPPEHTGDAEAKQRLMQEAQAASALDHANICTVHEIDETPDGQLFLAMAYYAGETLKKRIDRGPLEIGEAIDIGIQVAQGLARAHEAGIVHRDIKPANIMLGSRGEVKIVDFGLAKLMGQTGLTQTGTTLGTIAYMSPEQTRGADADARSDVWALGVMLYEALTGRLPFQGENQLLVMNAIQHKQPNPIGELRAGTPAELERIVGRALEKAREARYASAREVAADLLACQAALTAGHVPPAPARRGFRNATLVAVLASAAVVLAVGVTVLLRARAEGRRVRVAQQLAETERLADAGEFAAAFALARELERVIPADPTLAGLWKKFSVTVPIRSDPPGARVYRRPIGAAAQEWELLGVTPLDGVRFVKGAGYYLRLEADGHRTVELLHSAVEKKSRASAPPPVDPVKLDPESRLPAGMARIPGFTLAGVNYADYFMDRYEVTNREYKAFVDAGGYGNRTYWTHPFLRGGAQIAWDEAMALFKDETGRTGPRTWRLGTYPDGQADYPVGGVSWYEAAAYARFAGKELPTTEHWAQAQRFYREDSWIVAPRSNFGGSGPRPVGKAGALNALGLYDIVGNVREWCFNEVGSGRGARGGAWTDDTFYSDEIIQKDPLDRDATHGFRLVRTFDDAATGARLQQPVAATELRDYRHEKPVSESEFAIFRGLYEYEKHAPAAVVEATDGFEHWVREKVAFDLPYGGERGGAYLFLPRNAQRPLQTVIYWPHAGFTALKSIDDEFMTTLDFLVRSGRAVAVPIFKGTLHRNPTGAVTGETTVGGDIGALAFRDLQIEWVKDLSRTIDYLQTRDDLNVEKLAFYGLSWGSFAAPIALAVEPRIKTAVLNVGGFWNGRFRREVDPLNFAPRVRVPVLMINGEHDIVFPLETAQKPLFDLLGTAPAHKRHYTSPASHVVPRNELIKETLDWLDRYLGPVR
jgi:eukaryotic-like serine/threonine-protein kinase